MKLLLSFLLFAFIFSQSSAELDHFKENEEKAGFFITRILNLILTLNGTSCLPVKNSLDTEYNKALHCLATVGVNESFCNSFVNYFTKCTETLVATLESCMEPRKGGFPTALVKSLVAQLSFMCNTDGEHLFEILNPCVIRTFLYNHNEAGRCMRNFRKELESIYKKDERIVSVVCGALKNAKNCIKNPFESNCPNKITQNTVEELYNGNVIMCGV